MEAQTGAAGEDGDEDDEESNHCHHPKQRGLNIDPASEPVSRSQIKIQVQD